MVCAEPLTRGPFRGVLEATGTVTGNARHRKNGEKPCRPCAAAASADQTRRYWAASEEERERIRALARERAKVFRETRPEEWRARKRQWAQDNPDYVKAAGNKKKLRRYGMTVEDYDRMLHAQGDKCGGCGTTDPAPYSRFDVDHDHACCPGQKSCGACVRGLLCRRCNTGLGWFNDDPEALISAAAYLMSGGH